MIEKRTMGYVDFGYPRFEAKAVTVMYDTDANKVMIYRPDEDECEWQEPNDMEHFYSTVEEAAKALEDHKKRLFDMMPDVKRYLSAMLEWGVMEDKNDPLYHVPDDYLPYTYAVVHRRDNESYYEEKSNRQDKEITLLLQVIRFGTLSLKADTFRLKDVEQVKWGKERAELLLTECRTVETAEDYEYNVVRYLFGGNISSFNYTRLNKKETADD